MAGESHRLWGLWLPIHPDAETTGRELAGPQIIGYDHDSPPMAHNGMAAWDLEHLRESIDCRMIEVIARADASWDLICDEEAAMVNEPRRNTLALRFVRQFLGMPHPYIVGDALIVRNNSEYSTSIDPITDVAVDWVMKQWRNITGPAPSLVNDPLEPRDGFFNWPGPEIEPNEPLGN